MILIDSRAGSKDLIDIPPLSNIGVLTQLEYGDVCFPGIGFGLGEKQEKNVMIGVEVKSLSDFFQSFTSGRLLGTQIPGMLDSYDTSYFCFYGTYRCGDSGHLETLSYSGQWVPFGWRSKPTPYAFLEGCISDLENMGVRVKHISSDRLEDVVYWLSVVYNIWQKPASVRRERVSVFDKSVKVGKDREGEQDDEEENPFSLTPLQKSLPPAKQFIAEVAKDFPGIGGMKMAIRVAKYFKSVYDMVNAREEEWCNIDGIGKGKSRKIRQYITGEYWKGPTK